MHVETRKCCLGCCFVGVVRGEKFSSFGLMGCLRAVLGTTFVDRLMYRLQQTQLARTGNRFGAPLDLQLAKDFLIVSFHRFQGEDKPLANLLI